MPFVTRCIKYCCLHPWGSCFAISWHHAGTFCSRASNAAGSISRIQTSDKDSVKPTYVCCHPRIPNGLLADTTSVVTQNKVLDSEGKQLMRKRAIFEWPSSTLHLRPKFFEHKVSSKQHMCLAMVTSLGVFCPLLRTTMLPI
eukprot:1617766-Amphidinium_carterae.1